ncbi:MAG: LPS export ABC transporter ATP-binding protein [Deltaproteobacteria bacterium]|nr:LPS export ABC transporter ATP-binding protein [Deltaproteobacteria bacterium]
MSAEEKRGETDALLAQGLQKSFRGRRVVDGLDLRVGPGEVVGLLGPNGAGKTTSFHMLIGLLPADAGRVLLKGIDISGWPMHRRARAGIGYLSQEPSVFQRLSVRDNLRLYLEAAGVKGPEAARRADEVIEEYDLGRVADSLASMLSGGERRRLEIGRAMIQSPSFVLLDEPFSGVDPLTVEEIRGQIRRLAEAGIGLLVTDHAVRETLSSCDRAYIVKDGRLLEEGTPAEIARSERARAMYLGERFQMD